MLRRTSIVLYPLCALFTRPHGSWLGSEGGPLSPSSETLAMAASRMPERNWARHGRLRWRFSGVGTTGLFSCFSLSFCLFGGFAGKPKGNPSPNWAKKNDTEMPPDRFWVLRGLFERSKLSGSKLSVRVLSYLVGGKMPLSWIRKRVSDRRCSK